MAGSEHEEREIVWRGVDDESRLDVVALSLGGDGGLSATGTQTTETYRARWDLLVDEAWRTRLLTAEVVGLDPEGNTTWQRSLELWRSEKADGTSSWHAEGDEFGEAPSAFGTVGLAAEDADLLRDAVDVDLAGCPLTNTMPIRRLGLLSGARAATDLTMAWVSFPDLAVRPASQSYASSADGTVHYTSATRGVRVDLSVDPDGVVVDYPDLSSRLDLG